MSRMFQNLEHRQIQELALKPKMLQSLKMLQLPIMDLEQYLKQEIVENPMLEMTEEDDEVREPQDTLEVPAGESNEELIKTFEEAKELSEILDSWNDFYKEEYSGSSSASSDEDYNAEDFMREEEDLKKEYLLQLDKLKLTELEMEFALDLIDSCNNHGYLPVEFDFAGLAEECDLTLERAEEIHQMIMALEPKGITARNIEECLIAQLDSIERKIPFIIDIINNDFPDLIRRHYQEIADKYDIDTDDVIECRDVISRLDPKPGIRLDSGRVNYIVPDIIVKKINDEFEIVVNDFSLPKLALSRNYKNLISSIKVDRNAVSYVRNKINSAKFLIKSMYMRNRTLERVMRSIIEHQRDFFYNDSGILNPLVYSVIANELQVNESTISRVVKHKYADTPFGIMCLKDFFCSTAGKDKNYEAVSRQSVQQQIYKLVENEDKSSPLSDQEIVNILLERGISVSRRVIAKYRDEMKIPNSRYRRK